MVGQQGSAARGRPLGRGFTRPTKHQMYSRCGTSGEGPHDWRTMRRDLAAFPAPVPAAFCPYSVVLTPGVTLVEASAGTGKTTALTALVARLVVDPEARVIDDRTIDFHLRDGSVIRNALPNSCPSLGFEKAFTYSTSLSQLCSTDIITVIHTGGGPRTGASCGLGKFAAATPAVAGR